MDPDVTGSTRRRSGSGFFAITAKGCNLGPELINALAVATGHGDGQRKLKLLELMTTLAVTAASTGRRGEIDWTGGRRRS
jgi:hypothetical protein